MKRIDFPIESEPGTAVPSTAHAWCSVVGPALREGNAEECVWIDGLRVSDVLWIDGVAYRVNLTPSKDHEP